METRGIWHLGDINVSDVFSLDKRNDDPSSRLNETFKKGEFIYVPEENSDKIYFVNSGRVKIGNLGDGNKEFTKIILGKGEVFGELSLIGQEKRTDYAQAVEESNICMINRQEMKNLFLDYNGLDLFFMKIIGNRALETEKRLESLIFKDSRTRIIEFLIHLNEKRGQRVGFEWVVRKFLTHQEIASFTATSRQTVTTVLNELKAKNLLTFDRKRLLIRDIDKIKEELME